MKKWLGLAVVLALSAYGNREDLPNWGKPPHMRSHSTSEQSVGVQDLATAEELYQYLSGMAPKRVDEVTVLERVGHRSNTVDLTYAVDVPRSGIDWSPVKAEFQKSLCSFSKGFDPDTTITARYFSARTNERYNELTIRLGDC